MDHRLNLEVYRILFIWLDLLKGLLVQRFKHQDLTCRVLYEV